MKILIVADQPQRFLSQVNFALALSKKHNIYITFIIACQIKEVNIMKLHSSKSIELVRLFDNKISKKPKQKNDILTFLKKYVINNSLGQIGYFLYLFIKIYKIYITANAQIKSIQPDVVIVNGDRSAVSYEQAFLKCSKKHNIITIAPYTAMISDGIPLRMNHRDIYSIITLFDKIVFKFFDYTIKIVEGNVITFYNSPTTLTLKLFGTLSKNPWLIGNGLVDIICIDNQGAFNVYKDEMIDKNKFKIVGDIEYDNLYKNQQSKNINHIISKYKINVNKKTIILALPQLFDPNTDLEPYWNEINYIISELERFDANILISLHPKMEYDKYVQLEKKYTVMVLKEQLRDVLHCADLFISTNSSTIIWSIMLGIKTIVLNYFDLNMSYLKRSSSIRFVNNKEDFYKVIKITFESDVQFNNDWELLSKEKIFDGNTIERYLSLFEQAH